VRGRHTPVVLGATVSANDNARLIVQSGNVALQARIRANASVTAQLNVLLEDLGHDRSSSKAINITGLGVVLNALTFIAVLLLIIRILIDVADLGGGIKGVLSLLTLLNAGLPENVENLTESLVELRY
jgi:hypothetical protein